MLPNSKNESIRSIIGVNSYPYRQRFLAKFWRFFHIIVTSRLNRFLTPAKVTQLHKDPRQFRTSWANSVAGLLQGLCIYYTNIKSGKLILPWEMTMN
jgi:hypothetical protein